MNWQSVGYVRVVVVWSSLTGSALAVVCGLASDRLLWSVVGVVVTVLTEVECCSCGHGRGSGLVV